MSIVCFFSSCTALALKRLLFCSVCCCLGGCAWMDDSVFPRSDWDRAFGELAEMAKDMRGIAEAGATAGRSFKRLKEGMDSLGDLATELGSMPLPGRAVESGSPGALPDGTTATCGPTAERRPDKPTQEDNMKVADLCSSIK